MRTSVTLDDAVGEMGQKIADRDCRGNFSLVCEIALREYCTPRLVDDTDSRLKAAIDEVGGKESAIDTLMRSAAKKKRKAA